MEAGGASSGGGPLERVSFGPFPGVAGIVRLDVRDSLRKWSLFHETYTIASVFTGSGSWTCRRRQRVIQPDGLMLIEPGNLHITNAVDSPGSFRVMFVAPVLAESWAASWDLKGGLPHFRSTDAHDGRIFALFASLHRAADAGNLVASSELLTQAFWALFRSSTERPPTLPDPVAPRRLRRILDHIHEALKMDPSARSLSVENLAADAGMSSVQLIRSWRRFIGCPVWAYVTRLRLQRAQSLILNGPTECLRTLKDVAQAAGYTDLPHMNKTFQKALGVAPRAFAEQAAARRAWARTVAIE